VKLNSVVSLAILCFFVGLFTFSLLPAALELGAECTYPVPEGTSTGLLWMTSYLFALVVQTVMNVLRAPATASPPNNMENAVIFSAAVATLAAFVGVFGFNGEMKRRAAEMASRRPAT
jgi:hypothetical protein